MYVGGSFEVELTAGGGVTSRTSYYNALTARVMRVESGGGSLVYYTLTDQLGSASVTLDSNGDVVGEMRYYAFGETRLVTGSMLTDKLYTGQQQTGIGLYNYKARFYDPYLNRFISADTIVPWPGDPQNLNRYSYTRNNPIGRTDPTGHCDTSEDPNGRRCSRGGYYGDRGSSVASLPYTPPSPAPVLTNSEYITLIVFAESNDGSAPPEVIERIGWVAINRLSQQGQSNAFVVGETWGGTAGQPPTWDQTMVNFVYNSPSMKHTLYNLSQWRLVNDLPDETKRWALYFALTAYRNPQSPFHEAFEAVETKVKDIRSGNQTDPTEGAIFEKNRTVPKGRIPKEYAQEIETTWTQYVGLRVYAYNQGNEPCLSDTCNTLLITYQR